MSHDYHEKLFVTVCREVENQIDELGLVEPIEVMKEIIIPMTESYDGSFMDEVFEAVMEIYWNIKPKDLWGQLVEEVWS